MKILITGNMGYIGPAVVSQLRETYPSAMLIGCDMGYFGSCLTNTTTLPENKLDMQVFGDVRKLSPEVLHNVDVIVHLAAISNDPMGTRYEEVTMDVNHKSSVAIAKAAKAAGVKAFIFASSCSMYGAAEGGPRTEQSALNPLTAYARSKALTEQDLKPLADDSFTVTCLRFATACGMSSRLRLDLVLNDFVAGAVAGGKISILSDGSPWRPLIHIKDMARAIDWAVSRNPDSSGTFLAVNAGCNEWNYQVRQIAYTVAEVIPETTVTFNPDTLPDKRSYKVDFNLFKLLAPHHQPRYTLQQTIQELHEGLLAMNFADNNFRNSLSMRLKVLTHLQDQDLINHKLEWTCKTAESSSSKVKAA
ncbi:SDR family oxidoreductase [Mucilaginibacter sp. PAMB04168]|uniref:NAD-dependent epimerase/dehydratase family protein n=1 Tax=Mucilaginibacter sp. PAMB04168 TaxID=3138567 RepID=UPI0031F64E6B